MGGNILQTQNVKSNTWANSGKFDYFFFYNDIPSLHIFKGKKSPSQGSIGLGKGRFRHTQLSRY